MISDQIKSLVISNQLDYDVLIVGAGMVGSTLAAALGRTPSQVPLRIGLIEAKSLTINSENTGSSGNTGADGRASALALGTARILQQIGAWQQMQDLGVSPIHRIQVSDSDFRGYSNLCREDIQADALGYIVENWVTQTGLQRVLSTCPHVDLICPAQVQSIDSLASEHSKIIRVQIQQGETVRTLTAQLLIGADGMNSPVRQMAGLSCRGWSYQQACVVTTVTTELPHQQVAYERFQPSGPFAILPMTDPYRSCVVWTIRESDRERLLALPDAEFIEAITTSFGQQLGQIQAVSPRSCYVPRRQHSQRYVAQRVALVGDAAHATHPVGGQGVNMGMRDVAALATLLITAQQQGADLGDPDLLQRYQQSRRRENQGVLLATDMANRLFSNTWLPLQWSRRLGLISLDRIPMVKQALMRQAMGIAAHQPCLHLESWPDLQPISV